MNRQLYFNRQGQPIAMHDWARAYEALDGRVVGSDRIDNWLVSTVWLGLDHSFGDGPPLIFETMVFPPDDDGGQSWSEEYCERYSSEDEARAGHETALAWLRDKLGEQSR